MENEVLRTIALPGERAMVIRRMRPADIAGVSALYDRLSTEDRHRRFFSASRPAPRWTQRWVDRCTSDGAGIVAIVGRAADVPGTTGAPAEVPATAGDPVDGLLVAEAGFVPVSDGNAELAITIAAEWRGWLGPVLLDLLVDLAAEQHIPNLEAEILIDNRPMLGIAHHRGEVTLGSSDLTTVRVMLSTSGATPSWPPAGRGPRVLVESGGVLSTRARALADAGYEVVTCGGPAHRGAAGCPALAGERCPLVEGADTVVVALRPDDPRTEQVIASHRRLRPELRIIVQPPTDPVISPEADPGVCRLQAGAPSAALVAAVHDAVRAATGDH